MKDFGKNQEKMLKSLQSYLTAEQKTAIANNFAVKFSEFDWSIDNSLKHFITQEDLAGALLGH